MQVVVEGMSGIGVYSMVGRRKGVGKNQGRFRIFEMWSGKRVEIVV